MTDPNVGDEIDEGGNSQPGNSLSNQGVVPIQDVPLSKIVEEQIRNALKPVLDEVRGIQGRQDKDRSAFQDFLVEFKKEKATGLSDDDAEVAAQKTLTAREKQTQRDAALDAIVDALKLNPISPKATGTSVQGVTEHEQIIRDLGADPNDPAIAGLVRDSRNLTEFAVKVGQHVAKRATAPNPSTAQTSAPVTSGAQPVTDVNTLTREYRQKVLANRGKKDAILALKKEYSDKGVQVDSVNFA